MVKDNLIQDFPLLSELQTGGKHLIYLDNAATTQKPIQVIEKVDQYYRTQNANPHRGAYTLSAQATEAFEGARKTVAEFIGASSAEEIIFTNGATESLNMLALSYGMQHVEDGDEILISIAEHHSNLLPWQALAKRKSAHLRYLYLDENGRITIEELEKKLTKRTKIVAIAQVSNVLGVVNPIKEIAERVHSVGSVVILDGAQSVPHMTVDVQALDVDFMAFSGHKMLAPGGIGVLYGKRELLEDMEPLFLGGGMVEDATEQTAHYMDIPWKFEAGTQNVGGAVGLQEAIKYLQHIGLSNIHEMELKLTRYAQEKLQKIPNLTMYGNLENDNKAGIISFNIVDAHPHDVASIVDAEGIAIRAGHHCAAPLMKYLGINASCRLSLYFYNTQEDIDALADAIKKVRRILGIESA